MTLATDELYKFFADENGRQTRLLMTGLCRDDRAALGIAICLATVTDGVQIWRKKRMVLHVPPFGQSVPSTMRH